MDYTISIATAPERHLLVQRFSAASVADVGPGIAQAFRAVMQFAGARGISVEGPAVGHYTRHGTGFEVAAGFVVAEPVEGEGDITGFDLPCTEVATTTHIGPYTELTAAYEAIVRWADQEGQALDDVVAWEEYWSGPEVPESQHRTVVCWPLQAAAVTVRS